MPVQDIHWLKVLGGRIYFTADFTNQLWVSDGTAAGTRVFATFDGARLNSVEVADVLELNGRVILAATDQSSQRFLWSSGGTPESTGKLCSSDGCPTLNFFSRPVRTGNRLVFAASDGAGGNEPWGTDAVRTYTNPSGRFASIADTGAF